MPESNEQQEPFREVALPSTRGVVKARLYEVPEAIGGVILVGGTGGDFDTPAKELYPKLAESLLEKKISTLRIKFRNSKNLDESERDVDAGINFFLSRKIKRVALIGHSFGSAAVIRAGAARPKEVAAIACLAPQSQGTDAVAKLHQNCALLLIHGTKDTVLAATNSVSIHRKAHEPKEILLLENAGHVLDEAADEVFATTRRWLIEKLAIGQ